jgi:hypothetical protein
MVYHFPFWGVFLGFAHKMTGVRVRPGQRYLSGDFFDAVTPLGVALCGLTCERDRCRGVFHA